jgi:ligand-binding sensor protein
MVKLSFAQLIDIEQIQRLLEAHFKITGIISAILDTDGNVLAAAGWQDICNRFHSTQTDSCKRNRESDAHITMNLSVFVGENRDFKCKNGLRSVEVPIIIAGELLATFSTGQFFYDDDKPDLKCFLALESGFAEDSYLEALNLVPVFTREQIHNNMDYYRNLVQILVDMALKNLEHSQEVKELKQVEEELRQSETSLRNIFETIPDHLHIIDKNFHILDSNWHGGYEYVPEEKRNQNPYCYEAF